MPTVLATVFEDAIGNTMDDVIPEGFTKTTWTSALATHVIVVFKFVRLLHDENYEAGPAAGRFPTVLG